MIYDRTENDVLLAKTLISKLQSGTALTAPETAQVERGTYTVNTLNRVESKCESLENSLAEYFYFAYPSVKEWADTDFFTRSDAEVYIENIRKLKEAFFVCSNTPALPTVNGLFTVAGANAIEKTLIDIETNYTAMLSNFKQCGDAECGGT